MLHLKEEAASMNQVVITIQVKVDPVHTKKEECDVQSAKNLKD